MRTTIGNLVRSLWSVLGDTSTIHNGIIPHFAVLLYIIWRWKSICVLIVFFRIFTPCMVFTPCTGVYCFSNEKSLWAVFKPPRDDTLEIRWSIYNLKGGECMFFTQYEGKKEIDWLHQYQIEVICRHCKKIYYISPLIEKKSAGNHICPHCRKGQ